MLCFSDLYLRNNGHLIYLKLCHLACVIRQFLFGQESLNSTKLEECLFPEHLPILCNKNKRHLDTA